MSNAHAIATDGALTDDDTAGAAARRASADDSVLSTQYSVLARIYPGVELGAGCEMEDFVIIGKPPKGAAPGELPTRIGPGAVLRSHTVIYAGNVIGAGFQTGHGALVRE